MIGPCGWVQGQLREGHAHGSGKVRSCLAVGIGHEEDIFSLVLASPRHPDPSIARIANRECNQKIEGSGVWRRDAPTRGWRASRHSTQFSTQH